MQPPSLQLYWLRIFGITRPGGWRGDADGYRAELRAATISRLSRRVNEAQ